MCGATVTTSWVKHRILLTLFVDIVPSSLNLHLSPSLSLSLCVKLTKISAAQFMSESKALTTSTIFLEPRVEMMTARMVTMATLSDREYLSLPPLPSSPFTVGGVQWSVNSHINTWHQLKD